METKERIPQSAWEAFTELGYAETSTLEIATRARVSKRELYVFFSSKQAMLAECIAHRVQQMQIAPKLPQPRSREALSSILVELGAAVLREVSDPVVMAVFRLAIAEAQRAPEVAQTLQTARLTVRRAAENLIARAQDAGLLGSGTVTDMGDQFFALLWGDLMMSVLLLVREKPEPAEIQRRARNAAADFLRLNPASA